MKFNIEFSFFYIKNKTIKNWDDNVIIITIKPSDYHDIVYQYNLNN